MSTHDATRWFYYEVRSADVVVKVPFGSDFYARAIELGATYSKKEKHFLVALKDKDNVDALLRDLYGFSPGEPLVDMTVRSRTDIFFKGTSMVIGNIQVARCYGNESHFGLSQWTYLEAGPHAEMGYRRQLFFCLPAGTVFCLVGVPRALPVEEDGFDILLVKETSSEEAYVGKGMVTHHG